MTEEYKQPNETGRRGFTPLELLRDESFHFSQPLTGVGRLTFPPDPRFPKSDGTPRRLEWLSNPEHIATLTGRLYNKPGTPTLIQVAQDLVAAEKQEAMSSQILAITDPEYKARIEMLERRLMKVEEILATLQEIQAPAPAAPQKKTAPRAKKK